MTNEEFQRIVLEKFESMETRFDSMETRFDNLETRFDNLEKGQEEIRRELKATIEQTAELSEFRYEVNEKLDRLHQDIHAMEIITSKNWSDIAIMKAARQ